MENPIYSASPLWAFMGTFVGVVLMVVLGVAGLVFAVFNRKDKKIVRAGMGCTGLFLCAMGALGIGYTALTITTGAQTATVLLNDKLEARDNCGDGGTCIRYVLETTSGPKSIDFTVEKRAYEAVQIGGCYEMTYYPTQGLLSLFPREGNGLYESISYVTGIKQVGSGACEP
jgi:hypothetical protein